MQQIQKNPFARSPTLQTVLMVERFIEKNSAEYTYTELWKKLPKKVMWQTYLVILDYLQSINKIALYRNGTVGYIWNPELARKMKNRPEIEFDEKNSELKKFVEFASKFKDVKMIYLFGSQAKGNQKSYSDFDVCVFGDLSEKDRDKIISYPSDLIDISIFEELPLYIKFRVFNEGKPLLVRDKNFETFIKIKTIKEYLDFKWILNKIEKRTFNNG